MNVGVGGGTAGRAVMTDPASLLRTPFAWWFIGPGPISPLGVNCTESTWIRGVASGLCRNEYVVRTSGASCTHDICLSESAPDRSWLCAGRLRQGLGDWDLARKMLQGQSLLGLAKGPQQLVVLLAMLSQASTTRSVFKNCEI